MNNPHRMKAAEMFSVPYEEVTPAQYVLGKRANYLSDYAGNTTSIRILKARPTGGPYEVLFSQHFKQGE